MSGPFAGSRLALAQAKAQAARARLSDTIEQLQARARPTSLVHDVTETLKDRGGDLALELVKTARAKPARTGAALALVGLFFARRRVAGLVRSTINAKTKRTSPRSSKESSKP